MQKKELVVLIDGMLKYFKGPKKDFKHLRMDNSGENQAIARSCEENKYEGR